MSISSQYVGEILRPCSNTWRGARVDLYLVKCCNMDGLGENIFGSSGVESIEILDSRRSAMATSSRSSFAIPESVVLRWAIKAFLAGLFLGGVAAIVALINR